MASEDSPTTGDKGKRGLFSLWRRNAAAVDEKTLEPTAAATVEPGAAAEVPPRARGNPFRRVLAHTSAGLGNLFLGRKSIDDELFEELETLLLLADVGVDASAAIIATLVDRVKRRELNDSDALRAELRAVLKDILRPCEQPLVIGQIKPWVVLVIGVNGVGKTTTIGKLARSFQRQGLDVMLAAGDTFRAAAVEQLQAWGERNQVPVVAQHTGADSASVIFDGIQSAQARGIDVLIADTAGRLHTKSNLMEELEKIKRVMTRLDPAAPHEVLLVLDAGTGQNAIAQTQQFSDAVGVTGIVLTKLDGTAKGGVVIALSQRFGIPIRYIGVGEGIDDLEPFSVDAFVDGLLAESG
ncbi:MAG: signal recognition particle-docking protein FtsY [Porticoccaceae bacterium]